MKRQLKNITVLYNQPEITEGEGMEADLDTLESANLVADALKASGYETNLLEITRGEINKILSIKTDLVFNLIEWTGKNIQSGIDVIGMLEKAGLAYTGTGKRGLEITCNKVYMKQLFKKYGIPTPNWKVNSRNKGINLKDLKYPVITKPAFEHCGMGIDQTSVTDNKVLTINKIRQMTDSFDQPILTEEYVSGREIQATIVDNAGIPRILPPAEVNFWGQAKYKPILTYAAKWVPQTDEYHTSSMIPAKLNEKTLGQIKYIAGICYRYFEAWDYARLDMRMDEKGQIWVLELNNNPGIDYDILSGIGISARLANMTYPQLVDRIVENASLRYETRREYATA